LAPEVKKQKATAETGAETGGKPVRPEPAAGSGNVGQALRSAYQRTVNEEIPSDLLDLLGKLD
jgi:hypothetical protein